MLERDGGRCSVGRLLGGDCHPTLHVHHLVPLSEGGALLDEANAVTVCAAHHPMLEGLRRQLLARRARSAPRCRHRHPYPHGRVECERRLAARAA